MKLIRFGKPGKEKTGIVINNEYYDTSSFGEAYNGTFLENNGLQRLRDYISASEGQLPAVSKDVRIGCPFSRPSKIVCIGLNYADHARETGAAFPSEPVVFMKSTTAITGPNDDIMLPQGSKKTDWEVELAVIIGKKASYVEEDSALDYVAGYCLHNDVSEREFQMERNGTWDKGKGCDTFAPIGPYFVTKDEMPAVDNLRLWLRVNGQTMQDGTTADLIFKIPFLIAYVSRFMTLLPGDVVSTGTPAGVGFGMKPQVYLKEGDVVELGIDGLGSATQHVVSFTGSRLKPEPFQQTAKA